MTNLYAIYVTVTDKSLGQSGFLGCNTDLTCDPPKITFVLREQDESQIIAFFSKRPAETLRQEVIAKIQQTWPDKAGGISFDVREKKFSDKKAQQLLTGVYDE